MSRGSHEVEVKLPLADAQTGKRLLYRAGFRVHKRRLFEDNLIFDTPDQTLLKVRSMLRLREAGGKAIVTVKGAPIESKHKVREEIEIEVSHAGNARVIFERLGFLPVFRYQKYRTEYKQPSQSGTATLDETPIGVYLELEGLPKWIDRCARKLGYQEKDYITDSYGRLFRQWREKNLLEQPDMIW